MTIAYGCWRLSLLALRFRLIRQDRISGSGQVNNTKQHSLASECCSHEGGTAGTDGPDSYQASFTEDEYIHLIAGTE